MVTPSTWRNFFENSAATKNHNFVFSFLDSRFSLVGSTSSLRITNIKEEDAGTYQCRAENREDSLDASATIQVQVSPAFPICIDQNCMLDDNDDTFFI